ncbi:hypothetical protein ACVWW4_000740 [Bradyrhizobium sp. LB7.1]
MRVRACCRPVRGGARQFSDAIRHRRPVGPSFTRVCKSNVGSGKPRLGCWWWRLPGSCASTSSRARRSRRVEAAERITFFPQLHDGFRRSRPKDGCSCASFGELFDQILGIYSIMKVMRTNKAHKINVLRVIRAASERWPASAPRRRGRELAPLLGQVRDRASIISRAERPLSVTRQPPFIRSMRPWENISKSGTRAANRFVRSAQSRPLVARIAISRLRSAITANPSG